MTQLISGVRARLLLLLTVLALAATGVLVSAAPPANAEENPPGTAVYATRDLFVYAEAGEEIDWSFAKVQGLAEVTIRIDGPGGYSDTCSYTGLDCAGTIVAETSGVWRFRHDVGGSLSATNHSSDWDITVFDGDTAVPGRVWTEEYEMVNRDFDDVVDFSFWYLGEFGDLYRVDYTDFNGVNSTFTASPVGLVTMSGDCVPQYRSSQRAIQLNDADPSAALVPIGPGECGGRYKIFLAEPDENMPETATWWDGSTSWLYPDVIDPVLSDVTYTLDGVGSLAGTLGFDVENFQGALDIHVDVDGDGDADDPVDRIIPYFVSSLAPVSHTYHFDGLDGLGQPIPVEPGITFTITISRTGELHFVNTDAETRGGMQVLALRGPNAGDATLYWDDTVFEGVSTQKCSVTPVLDGTAGVDTSVTPAHGWERCIDPLGPTRIDMPPTNMNNGEEGSWGDARHILDWTFRTVSVTESIDVVGEPAPPGEEEPPPPGDGEVPPGGEPPLPATGVTAGPALAAAILLLGGLALVGIRRARMAPREAPAAD